MRVAFDLDGTLDKPALAELANILRYKGHEVHIITGIFLEAGPWQAIEAKYSKLERLGIPFRHMVPPMNGTITRGDGGVEMNYATLHALEAVDPSFGTDYRLRDLGLRKGALMERLGISVCFDDSELYCKMIPAMNGNVTILQVH